MAAALKQFNMARIFMRPNGKTFKSECINFMTTTCIEKTYNHVTAIDDLIKQLDLRKVYAYESTLSPKFKGDVFFTSNDIQYALAIDNFEEKKSSYYITFSLYREIKNIK